MIQGIERILKASIVDKNPSVSSAALVSSYHLFDVAKDIVRRWSNEVQEAVHAKSTGSGLSSAASYMSSFGGQANNAPVVISNSNITQYHALGLLYAIRQHDRMAVAKLVQTFSGSRGGGGFLGGGGGGSALKNPAAVCLLIRYACKVMEEDPR
jgi:coatomer protein complex subunit gamma